MAKYLWIGMGPTGASLSGTNIVDQYCFNKSGNWYSKQVVNGSLKWASTTSVPAGGDQIIFGAEYSDITTPTQTGWTAAKSPCLFGGFSGGVTGGVWTMTGPTLSVGNTFTSSLLTIAVVGVTAGYKFPYLGGGISGDIATWCAARDSVGVTYYTTANSTGFRDPSQNLKLKWRGAATIENKSIFVASTVNGITNAAAHDYTTKFVMDIDAVKAPTAAGGGTGSNSGTTANNPVVSTTINFTGGGGAGLRVRGGSFFKIDLNKAIYPTSNIMLYYQPYAYIADYGIEVYNAYFDTSNIFKVQSTYVSGCTASVISVSPFPWEIDTTNNVYYDSADVEISSNISAISTYTDLYGITLTTDIPSSASALNLVFSPNWLGNNTEVVQNASLCSEEKSVVIVGDRIGSKVCTIPTINIASGLVGGTGSNAYLYMPWAVEFAGAILCNTINNNAGFIYSNADIDTSVSVQVSELRLSNYGTLDFSKRNSGFDDWRFGGFTAAGTQIAGGIFFQDETAKILGSDGLRLWNTQTKGGGVINARITDTKSLAIPNATA